MQTTAPNTESETVQSPTDRPTELGASACSPSSFIAEVMRKDAAAVGELKSLMPDYSPPAEYTAMHTRGVESMKVLDEMTNLLRSALCICEREGTSTNWAGFADSIRKLGLSGVTARTYRQANVDLSHPETKD